MKNNNPFSEEMLEMKTKELMLNQTQNFSKQENIPTFADFEMISQKKQETSPIYSLNEDEILCLVESMDIEQLSNLSQNELNYIGCVLGIEPSILLGLS